MVLISNRMKKCNNINLGHRCKGNIVKHPNPECKKVKLCDNPECSNYYICSCGSKVGEHYPSEVLDN